jgi:hypothetical protein
MTRRVKLGAIAAAGVLGLGIVGAGVGQSMSNAHSARYYQGFQGSTTALTSNAMTGVNGATVGQGANGQIPVQKASQASQQTGGNTTAKATKASGTGATGAVKAQVNGNGGQANGG